MILRPGHAGIAVRPADHELAGGVDVIGDRSINQLGRQHGIDDFLLDAIDDLGVSDVGMVLRRDDHGVDPDRACSLRIPP